MINYTHPTPILRDPRDQLVLDDVRHALDQLWQVVRVALADTVDREAPGNGKQRHDLAPGDVRLEQVPGDRTQQHGCRFGRFELTAAKARQLAGDSGVNAGVHPLQLVTDLWDLNDMVNKGLEDIPLRLCYT